MLFIGILLALLGVFIIISIGVCLSDRLLIICKVLKCLYKACSYFVILSRLHIMSFIFQFNEAHKKINFVMTGRAFTTAGVPLAKMRGKWRIQESHVFEEHVTASEGDITDDVEIVLG